MYMKTKQNADSALSRGERVSCCGVLTSRSVTGEGSLPSYQLSALSFQISVAPVPGAKSERNEAGMSMKRKEKRFSD
jgi:hypothetical protein